MKIDDISQYQYEIFFTVRSSRRYHESRQTWFESLHKLSAFLTILMSGSVLFEIAKPGDSKWWLLAITGITAFLATLDIVINYAAQADLHRDLKRRWIELEKEMIKGSKIESEWDQYWVQRLIIESDEPPVYRVVELMGHNSVLIADGGSLRDVRKIGCWRRLTRHIAHWANSGQICKTQNIIDEELAAKAHNSR